jgi:hypothetical protein
MEEGMIRSLMRNVVIGVTVIVAGWLKGRER